jgi:hypothetical protein
MKSNRVTKIDIPLLTCECCTYSTTNKWAYQCHIKSKRHANLSNPQKDMSQTYYECKKCAKKYKSRPGLWSHNQVCSGEKSPLEVSSTVTDIPTTDMIKDMKNEIIELKNLIINQSKDIKGTQNLTINNNQQIHIYLNTHCKDAMNIDQFIDNMEITADDMDVFSNSPYLNGAVKLLIKNIKKLKIQERPLHCAEPIVNKPNTFFLKDDDEWKEESQGDFMFETQCVEEFNHESEKMASTKFVEGFGTKLHDVYKVYSKTKPKLEQICNRIASKTSSGNEKIEIMKELAKIVVCDQVNNK